MAFQLPFFNLGMSKNDKIFMSTFVSSVWQELNLGPSTYSILRDWIRNSDGKLSLLGYTKYLHGVTHRSSNTRHH